MMAEYVKFAKETITHKQLRSWLTMLGIVIGVAAIVTLISLGQSLENSVDYQFRKMGVSNIRVVPGSLHGPPIGVTGLTKKDAEACEGVPGVEYVTEILTDIKGVKFNNEEAYVTVFGYPATSVRRSFADVDVDVGEGRMPEPDEKGVAVVGYGIATDQFGKDIKVHNSITIKGKRLKVIGILEKTGIEMMDKAVFIEIEDAREIFGKTDEVSVVLVKANEGVDVVALSDRLERALKRSRGNENFAVVTPEQALSQMKTILGVIQLVLVGIASISLIVGGVGIMNTMYTSVIERTREIGTMKAIGARNSDILMIFLVESGLMGLVGGAIGAIVGAGIAHGIGIVASYSGLTILTISVSPKLIAGSLAFSFLTGAVSGTLPAVKAAKLKPVDALRYE